MYFERIRIVNVGPIKNLDLNLKKDGTPTKSLIAAGSNGAGKSFLLAHLLNAILTSYSSAFDDAEVDKGRAYKLRSGSHIHHGENYSFSNVNFGDFHVSEIQLNKSKSLWESENDFVPADKIWAKLQPDQTSMFDSNFTQKLVDLKKNLKKFPYLIFPPNRFEKPVWENQRNLKGLANYKPDERFENEVPYKVIQSDPLRENQDWLLDLLYDANAIERKETLILHEGTWRSNTVANGPANQVLSIINSFILDLMDEKGVISYSVGSRGRRHISVQVNGSTEISNLFSLSTGQTALLNIFLSIVRCNDLCGRVIRRPGDIIGTVIIDEVDLHLHPKLQYSVLPNLINRFPNVQFILTTHSPLFLLGLKNNNSLERFEVINLPTADPIDVEQFAEFETSFRAYQSSDAFKKVMLEQSRADNRPIVCVEGQIDVDYIKHAAGLLGYDTLLEMINLIEANGENNMKRVLKSFSEVFKFSMSKKFLFLFDCDVKVQEKTDSNLRIKVLPQKKNKLQKGIENLFSTSTLKKIANENPQFIDITSEASKLERGEKIHIPELWEVNHNEKRNLCNWMIANGTKSDFKNFECIFKEIESFLGS